MGISSLTCVVACRSQIWVVEGQRVWAFWTAEYERSKEANEAEEEHLKVHGGGGESTHLKVLEWKAKVIYVQLTVASLRSAEGATNARDSANVQPHRNVQAIRAHKRESSSESQL